MREGPSHRKQRKTSTQLLCLNHRLDTVFKVGAYSLKFQTLLLESHWLWRLG